MAAASATSTGGQNTFSPRTLRRRSQRRAAILSLFPSQRTRAPTPNNTSSCRKTGYLGQAFAQSFPEVGLQVAYRTTVWQCRERVSQEPSPKNAPKIFPSYVWSDERTTMVREVCERLVQDGIHCLLDQWHVKEGDDVFHFMEMSVKDPTITNVLIFCDALYASKADSRSGGVGTESQILTPELYAKVENTRFIPIICEYDEQGKAYQPAFLKSRFYIDFSTDERINANWEQLVRRIYGRPQFEEPPLGSPPSYILEPTKKSRPSSGKFASWKQTAAKNGPLLALAEGDYLAALLADLKSFYLQIGQNDDAESVFLNAFAETLPIREELLDLFATKASLVAGRSGTNGIAGILRRLLDLRSLDHTTGTRQATACETIDLFVYELFLSIAQLIRLETMGYPASDSRA